MLMDYTNGNIQHLGIPTDDMEKTVKFYESIGCKVIYETELDGSPVKFIGAGNFMIETFMKDGGAANKRGAIDHISLDCIDIVGCVKAVREGGYEVCEGPNFLPFWDYGVLYICIVGPNKEVIEFCQKFKSQEECDKIRKEIEALG